MARRADVSVPCPRNGFLSELNAWQGMKLDVEGRHSLSSERNVTAFDHLVESPYQQRGD